MRHIVGIFMTLLWVGQAAAVLLPKPSGKYHVAWTQHVFNKTTENDVLSPTGKGDNILVTIYYPTKQSPKKGNVLPYMDPISAGLFEKGYNLPSGSLQTLETEIQWQAPPLKGTAGHNEKPTLIFSPGGWVATNIYVALLSDIASHGFNILALDHPGEAPYLQYPYGGEGVYGLPIGFQSNMTFATAVAGIRMSDLVSLVDLFPPLVEQYGAPFNTTHYALFGKSLGGAASVVSLDESDAFLGGINLDGSIISASPFEDEKKPIFMITALGHEITSDPTLKNFVALQTGRVEHISINQTQHGDFSDFPLWLDLLDLRNKTTIPRIGGISGQRITEIQSAYSRAFFELLRGKEKQPLLEGPSDKFPEVVYDENPGGG